ncbi:SDR family NAD(P)-dependent oxidoreductase [Actinomarinicola tropica]|uniref:SDR family NAD(P)-dependent oxidoreductase n=1 Tax=Actinomarinicola tropica TaxID=2789776 RepID=A0A5Q2RHB7_9ACTN|nr:SDR family oxidoreductase [Actinomarinicola tropica]QGG96238.1 SDR family NAD(P)-dependent oxidoreductase [Actinomarinicola tropica]
MATAIITGGSRGLGRALTDHLVRDGWRVVIDGRDPDRLVQVAASLGSGVVTITGDVTDPDHRRQLVAAGAADHDLQLVVNNASELGPSPLPPLADLGLEALRRILEVNVVAPLALTQAALPHLDPTAGAVLSISSDAAVEAYPAWGGYGASKAALDHAVRVLAAELDDSHPQLRVWSVDPGDMRTEMHQAAFPGEDISDRPAPEDVVPALAAIIDLRPPSGRLVAADLLSEVTR